MISNIFNDYRVIKFEEKIKENVNSESYIDLKSKIFDQIISQIFQQIPPAAGDKEIVVSGYVLSDGKGDYFHQLSTVKALHKKFPDRTIRLISVSDARHKGKLPSAKNCIQSLIFTEKEYGFQPIISPSLFQEDIVQLANNSDLFISASLGIFGLFNSISQKTKTGIAIHEYDHTSNIYHQCDRNMQMGFGLIADGIFTKSKKTNLSWQTLYNTKLKDILFCSVEPSLEQIQSYLSSHQIFFCYMTHANIVTRYIKLAVAFSEQNGHAKTLDICYPSKTEIKQLSDLFSPKDLFELKDKGIGSVELISYRDDQKKQEVIRLAEQGKELRIIDVGTLLPKDVKTISLLSAPLIGCTGDNSLALALSYGKIPYYEVLEFKKRFFHNLLQVTKEKLGNNSLLFQFLEQTSEPMPNLNLVKSPGLIAEAENFGLFIQENYSFNKYFSGIVNNHLYCKQYPGFAEKQEELRQKFIKNEINRKELNQKVEDLFSKK